MSPISVKSFKLGAMEKLRQLTARHDSGRKPVVSAPFDSQWPQDYEQVDTNRPSQAVRPLLPKRIIRLVSGRLKRLWSYAWVLEISSIGIAILALAAMYITLAMHRDQPLPQWPGMISINSLIAIFTVVLKVTLMMPLAEGIGQLKWHWFHEPRSLIHLNRIDAASRGPWGSFLLIFSRYKQPLAVFGASTMLLALAIEPFSQQVTQYYQCLQPIPNDIASIPRTNNYTEPEFSLPDGGSALDSTMLAALYTGLIQPPPNATSSIPFRCSTGNCTFPEDHGSTHSSLAICSSCTDISRTVKRLNHTNTFYSNTYSLQSGPTIGPILSSTDPSYEEQIRWMSSSASKNVGLNDTDYIFGFDALMCRVPTPCADGDFYHCGYEPFAVNCVIYACLKTYRASITNFVLEEELLNTTRLPIVYENPELNSPLTLGFELLSSSVLRNGTWSECVGAGERRKVNPTPHPIQRKTPTQRPVTHYPSDCWWYFSSQSVLLLSSQLFNMFNDSHSDSIVSERSELFSNAIPWQMGLFSNGTACLASANTYMEGLANAMTSVIRQRGDTPSTDFVHGTVYGLQTCIKVQWAWLALPSALIVLTVVFLLATIITTRSWNMTWKSSTLALLFHGLDTRSREQYGEMMDLPAMEDAAKHAQAKLVASDAGWQFVIKRDSCA